MVSALDKATNGDFLCCTVDPHKALQESKELEKMYYQMSISLLKDTMTNIDNN